MASSPGDRSMHAALRTRLGEAAGEELIEVLAPLERGELAQRSDIAELRGDFARLEGKVEREIGGIKGKIGGLKGEIGGLKGEIGGLKGEIGGLKGEIARLEGKIDSQIPRLLYVMVPIMVSLVVLVFAAVRL